MTEGGGGGGDGRDDADAPLLPASSSENELREAIGARMVKEPEIYGEPSVVVAPLELPLALPPPPPPPPLGEAPLQEYPLYSAPAQEPSYARQASPPPEPPPRRARSSKRDDDGDDADVNLAGPRSRKPMIVAALALVFGLGIAALIFLGRANSDKYAIACEPEQVVAEQGRSFPPWGTHALGGAEWKPIAIPPQAECKARDTENVDELTGWYLELLVDQASTLLTAREVTKVDLAEQQLKQALLLARSPDKRDQRKEIERLLGDVDYWRALAVLRDATAKLGDAAKQFEAAAAQRPRHVSDASAWASYIRKVADELRVGPAGAHTSIVPPVAPLAAERPSAPVGTALPVEPTGSNAPPVAPPPAPDAGVPSGGVLL